MILNQKAASRLHPRQRLRVFTDAHTPRLTDQDSRVLFAMTAMCLPSAELDGPSCEERLVQRATRPRDPGPFKLARASSARAAIANLVIASARVKRISLALADFF